MYLIVTLTADHCTHFSKFLFLEVNLKYRPGLKSGPWVAGIPPPGSHWPQEAGSHHFFAQPCHSFFCSQPVRPSLYSASVWRREREQSVGGGGREGADAPGVGARVEHVELLRRRREGVHLDQPLQHHHDPVAPQLHGAHLRLGRIVLHCL